MSQTLLKFDETLISIKNMKFKKQENNSKSKDTEILKTVRVSTATIEVVSRGGNANAEHIKALKGVDNETGQIYNRSLLKISEGKANDPIHGLNNIKQQAGFSAEVASTAKDNANAIMEGRSERTMRSEDLPNIYGKNNTTVDRVKTINRKVIAGTEAQMKFVSNPEKLIDKIVVGTPGTKNDLSRYQKVKLELPSEQVERAKQHCQDKANKLREDSLILREKGKVDLAKKMSKDADGYEKVKNNIKDSGLTTEEAVYYRTHPKIATAKAIIKNSHSAGVEGAIYGAVIGGVISLFQNAFELSQGKSEVGKAINSIAKDTIKAGTFAYVGTFVGSAAKGGMGQSTYPAIRSISKTNLPSQIVAICFVAGTNIKRYVNGEIDELQLAENLGEQGVGMLSASMMATLGQIAIPIPVVGAVIGGIIGCSLSTMFYQSALEASRRARDASANYERTKLICEAARKKIDLEHEKLVRFINKEIPALRQETEKLLSSFILNDDVDAFAQEINSYAELLGAKLQFNSMEEFDTFMLSSSQPLTLKKE